ncbi:hypothetical protein QGN23_04770 [Chryseobacterium gotjawalense]|uniref:TonB C-terminal domain-containing protein n=1 Tax=Chryseobacterium gotjawalense TaxID=3042315 RepID=A0ABY8RH87_9FLAO|nr:hypothetical protein [Chryseobacterium sp. wdc7]WHF52593.1 hypothetical protein QGN23_04770 [Chryseobacterium sp. wdc7]
MQKIIIIISLLSFQFGISQTVRNEFESKQPQDLNVPPPPNITFPAQYPTGNKKFIEEIKANIDRTGLETNKTYKAKIILKIENDGEVLNISTYGSDENFNNELKKTIQNITQQKKWTAGKNKQGENVIDIVALPIEIKRK